MVASVSRYKSNGDTVPCDQGEEARGRAKALSFFRVPGEFGRGWWGHFGKAHAEEKEAYSSGRAGRVAELW